MLKNNRKYSRASLAVLLFFLQALLWGGCGRMRLSERSQPAAEQEQAAPDSVSPLYRGLDSAQAEAIDSAMHGELVIVADSAVGPVPADSTALASDSLTVAPDSLAKDSLPPDSLAADSLAADSVAADSIRRRDYGPQFLDDVLTETNRDSMIYDVRSNRVYTYGQAEVTYQQQVFKNVDYMEVDLTTKNINAHGLPDSLGNPTRPTLVDNGTEYDLNGVDYNLNNQKAKIRGVWTTEGDGFLRAAAIKKLPDNTFNIMLGTYTTCDDPHPHYEIRLSRGKTLPGNKTIFQWAYLVIEDVPIPFPAIPFGFFPMNNQRSSGFIMPSYGEEVARGFYLKDIGYQFSPNDYLSMRLLGSLWTLGSWETSMQTDYRVRYKFNGNFNLRYASLKLGDRGSTDYNNQTTYSIQWNHRQDPKSGVNFTANVNFSSSKQNQLNPATITDYTNNQASSSISYQKQWAGTPFSLSVSARHDQRNRDSTYSFTLPNLTLGVSRVNPFKFKNRRAGPERWYEKISMSYSGALNNSVPNVKEYNLFKPVMFDDMESNMSHNIPINASFTVLDFINITPSFTYREDWNTRRYERRWDPDAGSQGAAVTDTVRGFNRVYQYNGSVSANTTLYGMYEFTNPNSKIAAVRHTLTPNLSFNYRPDFGDPTYGFYEWAQSSAAGDYTYYSPYRGAPGTGEQAGLSFSLSQTLEAKVRTDRDSTGMKKIKIIDNFSFSFSYNFLNDTLPLSTSIPITLRSTLIKGFDLNLTTSLGITAVNKNGSAIPHYFWERGSATAGAGKSAIRFERFSTSFNWSKSWGGGASATGNPATQNPASNPLFPDMYDPVNPNGTPEENAEAEQRRQEEIAAYRGLLSSQYYNFNVPLTIGFNGNISYSNNGIEKRITPTLGFNGSVNLTPKWGITVTSGFDFNRRRLTPNTNFTLTRDLHCMQMNFSWVPIGPIKSYNFHIAVKSNILQDLKYEKSGNRWEELTYDR